MQEYTHCRYGILCFSWALPDVNLMTNCSRETFRSWFSMGSRRERQQTGRLLFMATRSYLYTQRRQAMVRGWHDVHYKFWRSLWIEPSLLYVWFDIDGSKPSQDHAYLRPVVVTPIRYAVNLHTPNQGATSFSNES